jgi:ABC-2 type transport system permease protein
VLGALATDVVGMVNTTNARELFEKLGGAQGIVDSFLATELAMMGIIVSIYVVQALLVVRHEETGLHAEPLLATGLSRSRWFAGHVVVAIGGAALILAAGGATAGLAHGARVHDVGGQLPRMLFGALLQLPAVAVVGAITAAAIGLVPRLAWLGWAALVGFLLIGELGPLLRLGQPVLDVSPFTHVPKLPSPGETVAVAPVVWLTVVAAGIAAAGFAGLRRRDIG